MVCPEPSETVMVPLDIPVIVPLPELPAPPLDIQLYEPNAPESGTDPNLEVHTGENGSTTENLKSLNLTLAPPRFKP